MEGFAAVLPVILFGLVVSVIVGMEIAVAWFTRRAEKSQRGIGPISRFVNWHRDRRPETIRRAEESLRNA